VSCISSLYVTAATSARNKDAAGDLILCCHAHPDYRVNLGPSTRVDTVAAAWSAHETDVGLTLGDLT